MQLERGSFSDFFEIGTGPRSSHPRCSVTPMTSLTIDVKAERAHERYVTDLAREWGIAEGRAQMALEHGIPDRELMLRNAFYAAGVHGLFSWLAFASPLAIAARRLR